MEKLSVVIITFNEQKNIGRCIDSVKGVADEVVVVDSLSTDNTKAICLEKKSASSSMHLKDMASKRILPFNRQAMIISFHWMQMKRSVKC